MSKKNQKSKRWMSQAVLGMVEVQGPKRSWATGFVVPGGFVVTTSHCLPRQPSPRLGDDDVVEVTIRKFGGRRRIQAQVIYADPCGDIAVLGEVDNQRLPEEAMAFVELVENLALQVNCEPLGRLERFGVTVRTFHGKWVGGEAFVAGHAGRTLHVQLNEKSIRIPGGTSGSPIFNDRGIVVGVAKQGSRTRPEYFALALPDFLPLWLLDRIQNGLRLPVKKKE